MTCDCFQIGGPFIAEDPDCEVHGTAAQFERDSLDARVSALQERFAALQEAGSITGAYDLIQDALDLLETVRS